MQTSVSKLVASDFLLKLMICFTKKYSLNIVSFGVDSSFIYCVGFGSPIFLDVITNRDTKFDFTPYYQETVSKPYRNSIDTLVSVWCQKIYTAQCGFKAGSARHHSGIFRISMVSIDAVLIPSLEPFRYENDIVLRPYLVLFRYQHDTVSSSSLIPLKYPYKIVIIK